MMRGCSGPLQQEAADQETEILLHKGSNIGITRHLLACLKPRTWLNDEVMNVFMGLLQVIHGCDCTCFLCGLCSTASCMNLCHTRRTVTRSGGHWASIPRATSSTPSSSTSCTCAPLSLCCRSCVLLSSTA